MKKIICWLTGACLLLLATTCLDEIEIELPDRPEEGYVVQAKLIQGESAYAEVKVERSFQFTSNINQAVTNAEVSLIKENGFTYTFPTDELDGIYEARLDPLTFPVQTGDRFRIEVKIQDTIEIQSAWETILEAPTAIRMGFNFTEVESVSTDGLVSRKLGLAFGVDTPIQTTAGERAQLRWEFIDAYRIMDNIEQICYIENPYQSSAVFLADGNAIAQDTIRNYPLFVAPVGRRHIDGYYLTAYQQALGPAAFQYWQEIASLLDREGTVFDNPAGTVSSNFTDQNDSTRIVYGYFTAFSQDTVRLFISREDMGELPAFCPRPPPNGTALLPTVCDDCILNALNSSLTKPDYWEE